MVLCLPRPLAAHMLHHLRSVYPQEGCGLVSGQEGQAVQIYPINNILRSPTAYEMDPLMQVKAMLAMETQGEALVAIYHSHPGSPPFPSETDIAQAYYPEAVYIIVSLQNYSHPVIKGFTIIGGVVNEANLRIE